MEGRLRYLEQLETRQTIAARPNRAARLLESLPEGQVLHNIGHNPTHEDQLSFSKMSAYTLQKDEWLPSLIQGIESNSGAESKTQYAKRALPFADFVSRRERSMARSGRVGPSGSAHHHDEAHLQRRLV